MYDSIMREIEPELTSAMLPTLDATYANETPEEKDVRSERYNKAFAEYDVRFQKYCEDWDQSLHTYKRTAMASFEKESRETEDAAAMAAIQSSLETE